MAPLVNLVNNVVWKVEAEDSPTPPAPGSQQATDEFKRMLAQRAARRRERAGLIGEGSRIVTISNSSTVQHALIHAQRADAGWG